MSNIENLLTRVGTIVQNSEEGTLNEIKNISNILEVDGKIATVLHFVHTDGSWNPHTIKLLEDSLDKLSIKG